MLKGLVTSAAIFLLGCSHINSGNAKCSGVIDQRGIVVASHSEIILSGFSSPAKLINMSVRYGADINQMGTYEFADQDGRMKMVGLRPMTLYYWQVVQVTECGVIWTRIHGTITTTRVKTSRRKENPRD